jgi:hypothetical protein
LIIIALKEKTNKKIKMKKIFIFLIILLLFCQSKIETYAFNLVSNYSFENGKEFWATNYSGVLFDILEDEAVEGTRSAKITNNKTSSFGVEQIVLDISSTLTYKISGWIKLKEPYPEKAFIRIAWYKSFDASGSQFSTEDTPVATPSSSWQKVELIKNPPEGINSAKIRLLVFNGSAIFDNILVEEFIPPSLTPTPAPTETPVLNCVGQACLSPTNFPTQNSSPTNTPIPTPISYQNIYLSEVYPNPQTGENEWVEIYNDNDFIVNLNNWYIDDIEDGGSSPKKFSLTIQPKSYAAFDLSTAMFNNDGDVVRLLDFEKKEKDSFEYKNSQKGKSFGRVSFESDEFCLQDPSKNQKNNFCLNPTPTKEATPTKSLITLTLSPIITSPTKSAFSINKKVNQNPYYYQTTSDIKINQQNDLALVNKKADVLGIYNKRKTNHYSFLSLLSFSYSVLSAFGIIIKTLKHFS